MDPSAVTNNVTLTTRLIDLINAANARAGIKPVKFVDQYGFDFAFAAPNANVTFRVTNSAETKDGWAENNFKVTGNNQHTLAVVGAERGDTFDFVVTLANASGTTKIAVGGDEEASIDSTNGNNYLKKLVPVLEAQRIAGLQ